MDDDFETVERFDKFSGFRNALRGISRDVNEWAGIPMPLDGENLLIVDPSYKFASAFKEEEKEENSGEKVKFRNSFWSFKYKTEVLVIEKDGKVRHGLAERFNGLDCQLRTLGCSDAWGIEQESKALQTLATLLRHRVFKQYLLTGTFLETSKKSGLIYMFRKLRPTVALTTHKKGDDIQILCALCMHPIAYYGDSWAGAMTPTDDVIAHLMMMRADEHMFWKRCNQHPAYRPEAGL